MGPEIAVIVGIVAINFFWTNRGLIQEYVDHKRACRMKHASYEGCVSFDDEIYLALWFQRLDDGEDAE
jgi:hypothetical protein